MWTSDVDHRGTCKSRSCTMLGETSVMWTSKQVSRSCGPEVDVWETRRNLKMNVKIKFLNWQSHVPAPDLIGINPNLRS
jgi:hypothetical protein